MKKIALMLVVFFVLSGCSAGNNAGTLSEKDVPKNSEKFNEGEVLQRINEIKEGATPVVGKDGSTPPSSTPPPVSTMTKKSTGPADQEDLTKKYSQAVFKTNKGSFTVEFYAEDSPITVNNFLNLAQDDFFDGTRFHRVIKDFMIQGGDPQSSDSLKKNLWGTGGPGYKFADEFNERPLQKGSLAMANSGPNTNGSQFFVVTTAFTPWLDGKHTNFGYVTLGMDVVDEIEAVDVDLPSNRPKEDVIIEKVELLK